MTDEFFSPFRGYNETSPGYRERLRDAYYQGFISAQEHSKGSRGLFYIDDEGNMFYPRTQTSIPLSRQRVEQMKIDMLLGITTEQHTFHQSQD